MTDLRQGCPDSDNAGVIEHAKITGSTERHSAGSYREVNLMRRDAQEGRNLAKSVNRGRHGKRSC
jgi:hypothetical protein